MSLRFLDGQELSDWYDDRESQMRSSLSSESFSDDKDSKGWIADQSSSVVLRRGDGRFFTVERAEIGSGDLNWDQPMIREGDARSWKVEGGEVVSVTGLLAMVQTRVNSEVSAVLVQAKWEPGQGREVLAPAVQASFSNALIYSDRVPMWSQLGINLNEELQRDSSFEAYAVPQDGGRFWKKHNLFVCREFSQTEAEVLVLPTSHVWATSDAIKHMARRGLVSDFLLQGMALSM